MPVQSGPVTWDRARVPGPADLLTPFREALGDAPAALDAGREVLARYAEPHRRYHDQRHLAELLAALRALEPEGPPPPSVVLAAYWHDAVYDPRRDDDEARSAELAVQALRGLGQPGALVDEVRRLVLLTATHDPDAQDAAGALLSDADLAVLAAGGARYAAYAADVRAEHAHVPDDAFRTGRSAVLRTLLDRAALYATARGRTWWEAAARANVEGELSRLGADAAARPPAGG